MQFWQIAKVSKPKRWIDKHSLAINVVGATIACSHIAIFIDKRLTTLSSDGHSVCVCVCNGNGRWTRLPQKAGDEFKEFIFSKRFQSGFDVAKRRSVVAVMYFFACTEKELSNKNAFAQIGIGERPLQT